MGIHRVSANGRSGSNPEIRRQRRHLPVGPMLKRAVWGRREAQE